MYDISDIKNYILFLKTSCGLSVTLHPLIHENLITSSELIMFNIHDNPYCVYVKSFPNANDHCIVRQKKILDKCAEGSFCGKCFSGVYEYVYPISNGTTQVGFISVSGYRSGNSESYIQLTSEKYHIPYDKLRNMYLALNSDIPEKKKVDTMIIPLCNMLELAYIKSGNDNLEKENTIDYILRYVKLHQTQNITIDDICREFGYSRSYVSHNFKKHVGQSFREYLTDLRLANAKLLLRYSKLDVADISISIGFTDYTYFSNVFKKKMGISPSEYRKKYKENTVNTQMPTEK